MALDRLRTEEVDALLAVFAKLDDPDKIYHLLQDLCTPREIADMSQRLHVARMLAAGERYTDIQEQTGASATTGQMGTGPSSRWTQRKRETPSSSARRLAPLARSSLAT